MPETITTTSQAKATPAAPAATDAPISQQPDAQAPAKTVDPMEAAFADVRPKEGPAGESKPQQPQGKGAEKRADVPSAQPGDKKPAAVKQGAEKDNSVIASIRNAEKAAKAEAAQLRTELEEYRKRGAGDASALTTTLAEKDQRIAQLEAEIGSHNYTKHPDFINQFQKPFQAAARSAQNVVESLQVITGVDDDGNKITRPASWNADFIPLTNIGGETPARIRAAAREQIKKMFGDDAPEAMQQWDKLKELSDKRIEAVNEWQTNRGENEAKERVKQLQISDSYRRAFDLANQDLLEQGQDRFGERPDDKEYNKIRSTALARVDSVFLSPEKLSPQEFIAMISAIRWRAANFDALHHDHAKLKQENAELLARINGGEESANGKTRTGGEGLQTKSATDESEEMMRKAFGGG